MNIEYDTNTNMSIPIIFEKITYDNLELACKIQNTIFPEEDGRQNFIEQINKDPYRKEQDYSIVRRTIEPYGRYPLPKHW